MFQQRGKCWCHAGGKGSRLIFTGLRADNMMISLFSHGRTGWRRCKNILQRKAGGEGYCTGTYLYVFVYLCLYIHLYVCVYSLHTHIHYLWRLVVVYEWDIWDINSGTEPLNHSLNLFVQKHWSMQEWNKWLFMTLSLLKHSFKNTDSFSNSTVCWVWYWITTQLLLVVVQVVL